MIVLNQYTMFGTRMPTSWVDDKLQNFKSGEIQDSSKFKFKYKSKLGFPTAWHKACKPIGDLAISFATTQSHPYFIPILPSLT